MHKNEEKLQKLKEKRTKILNEVMETETYKVAKEILEKYAPEQLIRGSGVSRIRWVHTRDCSDHEVDQNLVTDLIALRSTT